MKLIKDSLIDIIFLLVIISALFYNSSTTFIIIWIYTGLLLFAKISALFMPFLQKRAAKTSTPDWVYHIIYGLSLALLIYLGKWYLSGTWALIWIFSILISLKQKKNSSTK